MLHQNADQDQQMLPGVLGEGVLAVRDAPFDGPDTFTIGTKAAFKQNRAYEYQKITLQSGEICYVCTKGSDSSRTGEKLVLWKNPKLGLPLTLM